MPDAAGNFKGVALGGKAGEAWERIFGTREQMRDGFAPVRDLLDSPSTTTGLAPAPEDAGAE